MKVLLGQNNFANSLKRDNTTQKLNLWGHNTISSDQFVSFQSKTKSTAYKLPIWALIGALLVNPTAFDPASEGKDILPVPSIAEQIEANNLTGSPINLNKVDINDNRAVQYTFPSPYGEISMSQNKLFFEYDKKPFMEPKVSILNVDNKDVIIIETIQADGYDQNPLKIDLSKANNPIVLVKGANAHVIGSPTNDFIEFNSSGNTSFYGDQQGLNNHDTVIMVSSGLGIPSENNSVNGASKVYVAQEVENSAVLNANYAINAGHNNLLRNIGELKIEPNSSHNLVEHADEALIRGNGNTAKNVEKLTVTGSGNKIINPNELKIAGDAKNNNVIIPIPNTVEQLVRSNEFYEMSGKPVPLPKQESVTYTVSSRDFNNTIPASLGETPQLDKDGVATLKIHGANLKFSPEAQNGHNSITLTPKKDLMTFQEKNDEMAATSNSNLERVKPCIDAKIKEKKQVQPTYEYKQEDFKDCWKKIDTEQ